MLGKQKILINDVSVLFDLLDLDLFGAYFQLGHKLLITPQIIAEVKDESQKTKVNQFIQEGTISIDSFGTFETINQLYDMYAGLSFADCSVLESAIRNGGVIVSSDKALRSIAQKNNIEVKGLIWLIEELVINQIISVEVAHLKLKEYSEINVRAPLKEISLLIKKLNQK